MDDAEENTKRLPCNSPWETDNASTLSQRSQQISTLTYNEHVTIVVLKCTANLCQINRVKTYLISGNCKE